MAPAVSDTYLKSWLARVERIEEEQRAVGSDKRDLYTEAKSKGYNAKALRRIVAGRRRKDESEVEAEIDRYKIALGLAADLVRDEGLSLRDAAKRAGVSKSSVHRALAVPALSPNATPRGDCSPGTSQPVPDGGVGSGTNPQTPVVSVPAGGGAGDADGPPHAPAAAVDDLEIPPFLDRRRAAA
jgi:uncharacterized protein (UPF0335 family)